MSIAFHLENNAHILRFVNRKDSIASTFTIDIGKKHRKTLRRSQRLLQPPTKPCIFPFGNRRAARKAFPVAEGEEIAPRRSHPYLKKLAKEK